MKTDIIMLLDRSGSMQAIQDDVIGGFNAFVDEQRTLEGEAALTLVRFDHEYEVVYTALPLDRVPPLDRESFVPRGRTALLDAMARTILTTAVRLRADDPDTPPDHVLFVVETDGYENASVEFRRSQVVDLIAYHQKKSGWQFVYLGANLDAIGEARSLGIDPAAALQFRESGHSARAAKEVLSRAVGRVRGGGGRLAFRAEEREQAAGGHPLPGDRRPAGC